MEKTISKKRIQVTYEDKLCLTGLVFFAFGSAFYGLYQLYWVPRFGEIGCLFQRAFGIYCPGCGGTRAVQALLDGDVLGSLSYHPLVPYTVFGYGIFLLSHIAEHLCIPGIRGIRFHPWMVYLALVILAGNWIVRNLLELVYGIAL